MRDTLDLRMDKVTYCIPIVVLPPVPFYCTCTDFSYRPCSQAKRRKAREKRRRQKLRRKQRKH